MAPILSVLNQSEAATNGLFVLPTHYKELHHIQNHLNWMDDMFIYGESNVTILPVDWWIKDRSISTEL